MNEFQNAVAELIRPPDTQWSGTHEALAKILTPLFRDMSREKLDAELAECSGLRVEDHGTNLVIRLADSGEESLTAAYYRTKGQEFDQEAQALRFLGVVREPGEKVEVRCLPSAKSKTVFSGLFTDLDQAAREAVGASGKFKGVYFTLNPVQGSETRGLQRAGKDAKLTTDSDILRRSWLLVDIEGNRPDAKLNNATDEEILQAIQVAEKIREHFRTKTGCHPLVVMSGNGIHLLYRLSLPNTSESLEVVKAVLHKLDEQFSTEGASVDVTVCNASRISKLPGTLTMKGPNSTLRPQRIARVLNWGVSGDLAQFLLEWHKGQQQANPVPVAASRNQDSKVSDLERAILYLEKRDPAISGQNGDEWTFKTVGHMVNGLGLSDEDALIALAPWNARCQPPWTVRELREKIRNARKYGKQERGAIKNAALPAKSKGKSKRASQGEPLDSGGVTRRETAQVWPQDIDSGCVHDDALPFIDTGAPLPTQLQTMVEILRNQDKPTIVHFAGGIAYINDDACKISPILSVQVLLAHLQQLFVFLKLQKSKETGLVHGKQVVPSNHLGEMMLAMDPGRLGLPKIDCCSLVPKYAKDFTLIRKPGYHPAQKFLLFPGPTVDDVALSPSANQVREAVALIEERHHEFPYMTQSDKANGIALGLSPFLKELTGLNPAFLIWAPSRGTGKSLLFDVQMSAFLGPLDHNAMPPGFANVNEFSDEQADREIGSVLYKSPSVAFLDNVNGRLDSGIFAKLLTSPTYDHRVLGTSDRRTMPNSPVWVITANAPRISDEIARRLCYIGLDAKTERPEERTGFRHPDIRAWCAENRTRLIAAILTLIQNWIALGRPKPKKPVVFGSFQTWADCLGGILDCAGIPGFMENRGAQLERADDETEEWRCFFCGWWERFGPDRVTCGELIELVRKTHLPGYVFGRPNEQSQIVTLGRCLGQKRGRILGGYKIERAGIIRGIMHYCLVPASETLCNSLLRPATSGSTLPEEVHTF